MTRSLPRQSVLPEVGSAARRGWRARVVVVGAPAAWAARCCRTWPPPASARLLIVDHDRGRGDRTCTASRCIAWAISGAAKVQAARAALLAPESRRCASRPERCASRPANAAALVGDADVVLDAADSLAVTYVLSDACQRGRHAAGERLGARARRLRRASSAAARRATARCFRRCRAAPARAPKPACWAPRSGSWARCRRT